MLPTRLAEPRGELCETESREYGNQSASCARRMPSARGCSYARSARTDGLPASAAAPHKQRSERQEDAKAGYVGDGRQDDAG
jgi:hypothetical protein